MKVKVWLFMLIVFFGGFVATSEAAEQPAITQVPSFWCAVMDAQGSYQGMQKLINDYMTEFFKQGIQPNGALVSFYWNDPNTTAEADLKWSCGFQVAAEAKVNAPLRLIEVKATEAAVYLHVGPYEQLSQAYQKIFAFVKEQNRVIQLPIYDCYLNNPMEVTPDKLETRIVIPLEPK